MSALDSTAGLAVSAVLMLIPLVPISALTTYILNQRRGQQTQPVKMARIFLLIALPVSGMGFTLAAVGPAILARGRSRLGSQAMLAIEYTSIISSFLTIAAGIVTTLAVYLSGISVLYLVLGRQKWWKFLRVDALCGGAILLILDIAWFIRTLVIYQTSDSDGFPMFWLIVLVDATLCLLAAGVVGTAIYAAPKLKRRTDLAFGNLSALLLSASFLWLLRCTYVLALDLKGMLGIWGDVEASAQRIISPILDFWVSTTVLGLVTGILCRPMWSDAAAMPNPGLEQQTGYYYPPQSQYAYQQDPQMYQQHPQMHQQHPQMHQQHPQMHQQYHPQQPAMYQQQASEQSRGPVLTDRW
ncbi:hypothetical protein C8A00DRAFT_39425 [Chaetomidium leptoderma]|uniref:Uncharacterized protein n=1 Tax=Chaetomidium leptoderma TaxID=669021 RepID=A0AAN6VVJ4_9PEZI|nr:hypothetical protein C8A00DRAFT_39425 [Chaetomidium leptoderma]